MTDIKYKIGDVVYHAGTVMTQQQHPCPDCLGSKKWEVTSPAGATFSVACPRCAGGYMSNQALSLKYSAFGPSVRRLTIGSVRLDTAAEKPVSYMCVETGVGSGSVYYEGDLFDTEDEATAAAKLTCAERNSDPKSWPAQSLSQSAKFSDYELASAELASARDYANSVKAKVRTLFYDLRDCETLDEVNDRLDQGFDVPEKPAQ